MSRDDDGDDDYDVIIDDVDVDGELLSGASWCDDIMVLMLWGLRLVGY